MEEQRKHVRWNSSLPVKIRISGQDEDFSSKAKNLSNGGLCVDSFKKLDSDSVLNLTIDMPEDIGPINVDGKIAWQDEPSDISDENLSAGIKFMKLTYSDLDRIYRYFYKFHRQELVKRWWAAT